MTRARWLVPDMACRRWAAEQVERSPDFFSKLVDQQTPEWLWCAARRGLRPSGGPCKCSAVSCTSSQMHGTLLLGLGPGEVFVQVRAAASPG